MMRLLWLSVPLLLGLVTPSRGQNSYLDQGWWMDQPYYSDSYNSRVEYLDNVTLECEHNDTVTPTSTMEIQYWVLPDLRVMKANEHLDYYTLDGYASWQVSADSKFMYVTLVQEPQFGFYHCHLQDGNDTHPTHHVIKKAINYKEPYFTDLWDKYRMNTIIALSAAGGLLVIIICIYVVYVFRYRDPEEVDLGESDELTGEEAPNFAYPVIDKYAEGDNKTPVEADDKDSHHYEKLGNSKDGHQNLAYDGKEEVKDDAGSSGPSSSSGSQNDEDDEGITKF